MQIFAVTNPEGEVHVVQQAWVLGLGLSRVQSLFDLSSQTLKHTGGNKGQDINSVCSGETKKLGKSSHINRKGREGGRDQKLSKDECATFLAWDENNARNPQL